MILINGESRKNIEISDRGFQYGDGLFETIAIVSGQPVFLHRHLERLKVGCHRLYIPFPDPDLLGFEVKTLCRHLASGLQAPKAVLKLIVTRGSGGRGYRQPDLIQPTRVLSLHPFPDYPSLYNDQGITARFCNTRLGLNPALAGLKHLNRLEQVLARAEWDDPTIQEGIMMDINDHVIEGTMTNLFYVKNAILYTASLEQAGIAGIMRSIVMMLSTEHGLPVIEHNFKQDDLLTADEVFVSNAIIGLWPIRQIAATHFLTGPVTQQIQVWLGQFKREAGGCDQ
jgi:4-amino-4-deoxychorismate lyase